MKTLVLFLVVVVVVTTNGQFQGFRQFQQRPVFSVFNNRPRPQQAQSSFRQPQQSQSSFRQPQQFQPQPQQFQAQAVQQPQRSRFQGFRSFLTNFQQGASQMFQPVQQAGRFVQQAVTNAVELPSKDEEDNTDDAANEELNMHGGVGGTKKPVSTGKDDIYPEDCGRDAKKKTGLLCFPDGKLCEERVNRGGNQRFGNHLYWMSWNSDDSRLKNAKWDWFNARNYCRKRCMDLVSIETQAEYEWIKGFVGGNVPYFWTSGRLCNFDGCDRPDFFPKNINGWFWSANQARLNPTNGTAFHDWSRTGGFRPPRPQPDNREQTQQNGEEEACMAVLNNFYGDGVKWHDVSCHHEKPIICEDVEGHLAFARQNFPQIRIP